MVLASGSLSGPSGWSRVLFGCDASASRVNYFATALVIDEKPGNTH
jgi:hypothetical protein